jgi:hypothetical protein
MPAREQKLIRLSDNVMALLDQASEQGSASRYIEALIERRWSEWTAAMRLLTEAGWTPIELRAACDALNGRLQTGHSANIIAHELGEAQRLRGVCAAYGVVAKAWAAHIKAMNPATADALAVVCEEYWAGNHAVMRALGESLVAPEEKKKNRDWRRG